MTLVLKLKEGKEANVGFRHPWVFSGALEDIPEEAEHGSIVKVADRKGDIIGVGTLSKTSSIAIRVFAFGDVELDKAWFVQRFREADKARAVLGYGPGTATTGYRVVFSESDNVPGLIVDRYGDVLVVQLSTAGIAAMRGLIVEALKEAFSPTAIVERSDIPVRKEEKLKEERGILFGGVEGPVAFLENGVKFEADVIGGQKTGFFLDQKELRREIMRLGLGRDVLNLFSYTGAAGVAAMKGGAKHVLNVDASEEALAGCARHAQLNGFDAGTFETSADDIFQYLGANTEGEYDMVVMDPPALIKSHGDVEEGRKAYHFLNRAAMRLVRDGGIFVTSSCSRYLSEEDLAFTLRRASVQAGIRLHVLGAVHQAPDHPTSVYFPEALYLKSFVCLVRKP